MIAERIKAQPIQFPELTAGRVVREIPAQAVSNLRWVKPNIFRSLYELRSAGKCLATMRVQGLFRPGATSEGIDGC